MNYQGRKVRLWYLCWGILAAKLGDAVVAVLFRVEALAFPHFYHRGNLRHVRHRSLLDVYEFAWTDMLCIDRSKDLSETIKHLISYRCALVTV